MKKFAVILGVVVVLVGVVLLIVYRNSGNSITEESIQSYIDEHKDRLIPQDPVLGGTWYITEVNYDAVKKSGTFSYEDGHVAGSAAFQISKKGRDWAVVLRDYVTLWSAGDLKKMRSQTGAKKGVLITVHEVVDDYRCPIDVQCIEGGAITVNVTLSSENEYVKRNIASDEVPVEFDGHKISIARIQPPARSGITIAPGDYQITFRVE